MRDRLHSHLAAHPEGVAASDLLDLVFSGKGADTEFGRAFVRALLADDPRVAEREPGVWEAVEEHLFAVALVNAPFVVVDLETTGLKRHEAGITEIGAVRLSGNREVARFETLVNPGVPIPPYVAKLTGITDAMVADAPPIDDVLESFVDFASGAVLVAHNAAFDVGMLDSECRRLLGRPLGMASLCTVKLAARLLPQLRRTSLDALSEHFSLPSRARHRAMGDAELTAAILKLLIAVLAEARPDEVLTVSDLLDAQDDPLDRPRLEVGVSQQALEELPEAPGVYRLIAQEGESLFVARAANLRQRVVRHFLDHARLSSRQVGMIVKTRDIAFQECGSELEAALLEAREVRRWEPTYNRSGKHLPNAQFVKIDKRGRFPRVSVASRVRADRSLYVGPLRGRGFASDAAEMLAAVFGLRTCEGSLKPAPDAESCGLATSGWCSSPCNQTVSRADYTEQVRALDAFLREGGQDLRERVQKLDLSASNGASSRFPAAMRRLGRLHKRGHWLVNAVSYLALAPAAGGEGMFFAAVVDGQFVESGVLRDEEDIDELVARLGRARSERRRRGDGDDCDAGTVLIDWLDRNRSEGEVLLPLESLDARAMGATAARLREICAPL